MNAADIAKELAKDAIEALAKGFAAAIDSGHISEGYAAMAEHLSDKALAARDFPDGKYVPPT